MSNDTRRPHSEALPIAQSLARLIKPHCTYVTIAGSLRRLKETVGDIEIVAIATPALLPFLDGMVIRGEAEKAVYSDGHNRWGKTYRGLLYQGMKCEIFLADDDNVGYQTWLRTGPGDANTYVMQFCSWRKSPYRAAGGYWWAGDAKLHINTEQELFAMLGMQWLHPKDRTEDAYRLMFEARWHKWGPMPKLAAVEVVDTPVQLDMFGERKPRKVNYE